MTKGNKAITLTKKTNHRQTPKKILAGANSYKTATKSNSRNTRSTETAHKEREEQKRDNTCLNT